MRARSSSWTSQSVGKWPSRGSVRPRGTDGPVDSAAGCAAEGRAEGEDRVGPPDSTAAQAVAAATTATATAARAQAPITTI
ncbi:hypothetical protein GCM10010405_15180 [Streptomyces macrosporus]|uniref:Uncharacterized protein n=1 Tax=Streptomyces macrosporus TaxID=44032 RepID=A0ABP5WQ94_9ACTN